MNKTSKIRLSLSAIGLAALLGLSACGSDEKPYATPTAPTEDQSDAGNEDTPATIGEVDSDATTPAVPGVGLSEKCTGYYQLFATAFTGDASGLGDLDQAISDLKEQVPEELKNDVETVAKAYATLVAVAKKYEDNPAAVYTDPELLAIFADPEFGAASERVNTWLQTESATGTG